MDVQYCTQNSLAGRAYAMVMNRPVQQGSVSASVAAKFFFMVLITVSVTACDGTSSTCKVTMDPMSDEEDDAEPDWM